MEFQIAKAARVTGQMLERLVREKLQAEGIPEPDAVICYGAGYSGPLPTLNASCSRRDKFSQGLLLQESLGDEALQVFPIIPSQRGRIITRYARTPVEGHPQQFNVTFPLLSHEDTIWPLVARKKKHSKGRDMRVCKTIRGVQAMLDKGRHDFVTPIVDSDTEYRVWVYRKRVLAVYEKRLTEPENNTKFGRNRANGWTFHALGTDDIPESVRDVSKRAVAALGLDFGAVDVLGKWEDEQHTDVHATVLEVNSAPGVSDEHRSCIVKLTHRVVRWAANGCPGREA